ncbi:hypothetical protein HYU10_01935 [Candidatus Woesearchaeota archaeon]|nr:hypothetical protein [Candidatus Woesearchaeota archaeon]MBI2661441.1 hypothetical protein [Candidatus Woesearchaeota archaeon]
MVNMIIRGVITKAKVTTCPGKIELTIKGIFEEFSREYHLDVYIELSGEGIMDVIRHYHGTGEAELTAVPNKGIEEREMEFLNDRHGWWHGTIRNLIGKKAVMELDIG